MRPIEPRSFPRISGLVLFLLLIAIADAVARFSFLAGVSSTYDQLRQVLPATEVPFHDRLNGWFLAHKAITLLHIIPGTLLLVLAPFQFLAGIRNRHIGFHRWSGRALVVAAMFLGMSGIFLGAVFPNGSVAAALAIYLFGTLFLLFVIQAILAIRRKDMVRHRVWMIRMFSLGLSAGTIRIVGVTLLVVAPASAVELRAALALWLGFALSLAGGEIYLR